MNESFEQMKGGLPHAADMFDKNELTAKVVAEVAKDVKDYTSLATAATDARAAIDTAMQGIGRLVESFPALQKDLLQSLRLFRMSAVTECAQTLKAFQDIRTFFLSKEHEAEITRLKEFIEICERLESLKASGLLDAIADTILRLECHEISRTKASAGEGPAHSTTEAPSG